MATLCPRCQAPQRPTARFCRMCGASLGEPSLMTTSEGVVRARESAKGSIKGAGEFALPLPWTEEERPRVHAFSPASPLLRLEAFFFDLFLVLGAMLVAVIVAVAVRERLLLVEMALWSALAAGLVWGANHLILCSVRGQSVGMALVGIRIVRADGRPISWGRSLLRHTIGYGLAGLSLGLGFLWMFVDKRGRGWPDLVSGTCVIEEVSDD